MVIEKNVSTSALHELGLSIPRYIFIQMHVASSFSRALSVGQKKCWQTNVYTKLTCIPNSFRVDS